MQHNFTNARFSAHVIISFMQQLEFISFEAQGIKFMQLMTANGFSLLDIRSLSMSASNVEIFQFSILFYSGRSCLS